MDAPSVLLNVAQRASVVLDFSRIAGALAASPSLWIRMVASPAMYPTYDPNAPSVGLFGAATGMPLQLTWKGLITFAGEGGGLPTYADADVPTLPIPAQGETNYLTLRPLVPQPAPAPDFFVDLLVAFQADSSGVNRAYINGATNPGPSSADLSSPPLLAYLSAAGGPLSSGSPAQGSTLAGSATQPFVLPYGKVIEVYINNTDVRSALFVQPNFSLSAV